MSQAGIMEEYAEQVKTRLPGGVHYNFKTPWAETPIQFSDAQGARLIDMDGKVYLDLYARFGANIMGYACSAYQAALKEAVDRLSGVSHSYLDLEVLKKIHAFVPSAEMIRFGVSGTEIVQNALRLARAYTGRNYFVRFQGHYHGNADNIMGGKVDRQRKDWLPREYLGDIKGTAGRATGILESQSFLLPWNDIAVLEALLADRGEEIAAIITEPVCVNGGSIMPAPGYLQQMRALCDRYGIVLIFDEIITGVRMGLGGAQTYFDVVPDLTTMGKAVGGGAVPVAVLAGKQALMELLADKTVIHAGTFNGYGIGQAAILATLQSLSENNGALLARMEQQIVKIHALLLDSAKRHGLPLVIQGPAGCAAYHCCEAPLKTAAEYTHQIMSLDIILNNYLAQHGVLVSTFSRLYPTVALSNDDVEWFSERVDKAISATSQVYEEIIS